MNSNHFEIIQNKLCHVLDMKENLKKNIVTTIFDFVLVFVKWSTDVRPTSEQRGDKLH